VRADWADLLRPAPPPARFYPALTEDLPEAARRWLRHAIVPGAPLYRRAWLRQHGRIRLGGRWWPFRSVQALDPLRGYVWPVRTRMLGLPLVGVDRLSGGSAEMVHRLLGVFPLVSETGPDLVRSAAARAASETCWVPAAALDPAVTWEDVSPSRAIMHVPVAGETFDVTLDIDADGAVRGATAPRWARLDGGPWQWHQLGARALDHGTFAGFTVPTSVVIGYGERYWSDGAFIHLVVDDAAFR